MGAAVPVIYAVSALVGAGAAAYGAAKMSHQDMPKVEPPPEIPIEALPEDDREKRKHLGRKSTILTGPLLPDDVLKPTLLGQ